MKKNKTFWLNYFRPSLFIKGYSELNIFSLKRNNIKMVICDLDNTLAPHFTRFPNRHAINFVKAIQKEGILFVLVSNNTKKRVQTFAEKLQPDDLIYNARKPLMRKVKKMIQKHNILRDEIIVIGDQIVTDIWIANRIGCKSVLVLPTIDPNNDASTSWIFRIVDKYLYQKLQHNNFLQIDPLQEGNINNEYEII